MDGHQMIEPMPSRRRNALVVLVVLSILGPLGLFIWSQADRATAEAGKAPSGGWFTARLEFGEAQGYAWGVRATGPKHRPLGHICEVIGKVAPFDPSVGYVESNETKACGSLRKPTDSVSASVILGSPESAVTALLASLYPPDVREVTFVLDTGERRNYRPSAPKIKNRTAQGIPVFRYLAALFDEGSCIRRIITSDDRGRVIKSEKAEPACPAGTGGT